MFWDNFSKLCTKVGKSPNAIGKEIGVSSGTITHWKSGKAPRAATLVTIAEYFGVDVSDLLGTATKNEPSPKSDKGSHEYYVFHRNGKNQKITITPEQEEKLKRLSDKKSGNAEHLGEIESELTALCKKMTIKSKISLLDYAYKLLEQEKS